MNLRQTYQLFIRRHGAHISEHRLAYVADRSPGGEALSVQEQTHLQECGSCRDLAARHRLVAAVLQGPWELSEISGLKQTTYAATRPSKQLIASSLGLGTALVAAVAVGGMLLSGVASSQPEAGATVIVVPAPSRSLNETQMAACDASIAQYGDANAGDWGGFGVGPDGSLVVGFTARLDENVSALRAMLPPGCPAVIAEVVAYTYSQLTQVQNRVTADWSRLQGLGAQSIAANIDVASNQVRVYISPVTPALRAAILADGPPGSIDLLELSPDANGSAMPYPTPS
jgi:hypothetical protein